MGAKSLFQENGFFFNGNNSLRISEYLQFDTFGMDENGSSSTKDGIVDGSQINPDHGI